MNDAATRRLRTLLAGAAATAAGLTFFLKIGANPKPIAAMPVLAPVVGAVLVQFSSLGAQLLARGLWWSNFVLGLVLVFAGSRSESTVGLTLVLGCGAALALADRRSLTGAAERADFRPVAYAGTLQLLMVLALADAPTLLLFSQIEARHGERADPAALMAAAALLLVGFVGLYRLRLWGVLVTAGTGLALGTALATGVVRLDRDLNAPLTAICAVQVLAAAPMLVSLATRRPLPALPSRTRGALATVAIALLALAAVVFAMWRRR